MSKSIFNKTEQNMLIERMVGQM